LRFLCGGDWDMCELANSDPKRERQQEGSEGARGSVPGLGVPKVSSSIAA
jgi:hypothetical protein